MAKRKSTIDDLMGLKSPGDQQPKKEKPNPVSVGLDQEDLTSLEEIAEELGQSRHAVMRFAIRDFIRRYEAGERPKTKKVTITKEVFDLE